MSNFSELILLAPPILFALSFHEFSHGYIAFLCGDSTAKDAGRLTLNPLVHLDLLGTVMLFLLHFGWAKPVPVNYMNLRNPKRDMIWVALAGPGANMLIALISGLLVRTIDVSNVSFEGGVASVVKIMLVYSVIINLSLAIFNLLPIPPLDGSRVLAGFVPSSLEGNYARFEIAGPLILLGLVIIGSVTGTSVFTFFIWPFVGFFSTLFSGYNLASVL